MINQTTWRGQTQEVVNENKGHSRMSLSRIFHACCYQTKRHCQVSLSGIPTAFNNQKGGDPRLQTSGMTSLFNPPLPRFAVLSPQGGQKTHRGFTLIELLIVVLIIAILAAVALPQYNKAVRKAQGTEALAALDAIDKALTNYYLEYGTYEGARPETLNIDIPELKHFRYAVGCTSSQYQKGSTQLTQDYLRTGTFKQQSLAQVNILSENIYVISIFVQGKRSVFECGVHNKNGTSCSDYFNCNATPLRYVPQAGTEPAHYEGGNCFL